MKREYVLITGGTGFIGSHVIDRILRENSFRIIAIVRKINNYKNVEDLKQKGVILIQGNFYEKNLIEMLFRKYELQYVIHIAAIRGEGTGTLNDYSLVNVQGTEILLEASLRHHVKKFIFCSSVGVFGTIPKKLPADMNTDLNGDNDYHNSKILAEEGVCKFINNGLNAYIVRPAITYGFKDTGFSATLVKIVRRKMLLLPIKDNKIHLLDVCRLAEIFITVLKKDNLQNRLFIAADEDPIILRELADLIHHYFYKKGYPRMLRLPGFIFDTILKLFQILNNSKLCVSIQLLYRDWYYNTDELSSLIDSRLSNTKKEFLKYLGTLK